MTRPPCRFVIASHEILNWNEIIIGEAICRGGIFAFEMNNFINSDERSCWLLRRLLHGRLTEKDFMYTARNDSSTLQVRHCEPRNPQLERDHHWRSNLQRGN